MFRRFLRQGGDTNQDVLVEEFNDNVRERIHNKLMFNRELLQHEKEREQEQEQEQEQQKHLDMDMDMDINLHRGPGQDVSPSIDDNNYHYQINRKSSGRGTLIEASPINNRSKSPSDINDWDHRPNDWDHDSNDYESCYEGLSPQHIYNSNTKYYQDVDGYLTEQNRKFNQLIDKNLNYVAHNNLTDIYKQQNYQDLDDTYNLSLVLLPLAPQINHFLSTLDDDHKFKLYQKLSQEFNPSNRMIQYSLLNHDQDYIKTLTVFEKFELVLILIIKLNFLLIKYSVPITKRLYKKFMNNQLLLVNNDNFNRLLNLVIKLLNNLETNYYQKRSGADINIDDLGEDITEQINELDQWDLGPSKGVSNFISLSPTKVVTVIYNYYRGGVNDMGLLNAAEEFVNQI